MELLTSDYLPLLICISLIVIGATLLYMYIIKNWDTKSTVSIPTKVEKSKKMMQAMIDNKNIEHKYQGQKEQEDQEEVEEDRRAASTTEAYTSGTFRIKPKHTMDDDENDDDGNEESQVLENFNAPTTKNGNVRQSMGSEDVLNSRNPNSLSFIDKLQKRFDSSS